MVHSSLLPQRDRGHVMHPHLQTSPQTQNLTERKTAHVPLLLLPLPEVFYRFPEVLQAKLLSAASLRWWYTCRDYAGNPPPPAVIPWPHPALPHP